MIPTPGFPPSKYFDEHPSHHTFDQHHSGQTSGSVHLEELAPNDEVDPEVDDEERDELVAEEIADQEVLASNPRGELTKYVRAVPRSQWQRDSDGKYFLEWHQGG